MISDMKYTWFVLLTFLMMFSPPVLPINIKHIIGLISILWITVNWNCYRDIFTIKYIRKIIFLLCLLPLYVMMVAFINDKDMDMVYFYLYTCVDLLPFSIVLSSYVMRNDDDNYIYKIIVAASFIEIIMVYLSFFFEPIQNLFVEIMANRYGDVFNKLSEKRMFGFADSLTFSSAIIQAVIAWIYMYKEKISAKSIGVFTLIFGAGVLNARTTIVVLFIGFVIYIISTKASIKDKMITLFCGGGFVLVIGYYCFVEFEDNLTMIWINEGVEEIIGFFQGETETGYFSYLTYARVFALPESIEERIFGTGYRIFGGENMFNSSDVGYINDIWIGGYVFVVLLFIIYSYIFYLLTKSRNDITVFLGRYMLLLYPIINIKGQVYLISDITCLIIMILVTDIRKGIDNGK